MKWLGPTWITVDLSAIKHNLVQIKNLTTSAICPVLKGDAYGHGLKITSMFFSDQNIKYLAVSDINEALEIRAANVDVPILILTPLLPVQARSVVENKLTATITTLAAMRALAEQALTQQQQINIQIKINTGMNRVGISSAEIMKFLRELAQHKYLKLEGIYTHFSAANHKKYTRDQLKQLLNLKSQLASEGYSELIWHSANSTAFLTIPESHLDMVRIGTALFGQSQVKWPTSQSLRSTWQFFSRIIQITIVAKGASIGYNQTYTTKRNSIIGVIPVGYSDGLGIMVNQKGILHQLGTSFRQLVHNPNFVEIDGCPCPIVGKIAMGMCCIDLTDHPNAINLYGAVVKISTRRTTINRRIPKAYLINNKVVLIDWHDKIWQPLPKNGMIYLKEISTGTATEILQRRNHNE